MKDLLEPAVAEEIRQRILALTAESPRQWGKMTVAQTLAHCNSGMLMAMGTINPKRVPFPISVLGLLIKPLVFRDDKPMRRNSPSVPELFSSEPFSADSAKSDFERERSQLVTTFDSFVSQGAACCSSYPHPFFGPLKPPQWGILMYKHLDHHLRQFGA